MNKTADRTVALDKGRVDVYTKNGVTLYAYQTRDLIDNEVFVLAKKGRGVVIELPCFFDNIRELTDFLKSKGVTVEAKFVAYHAAGASFLPEVPAYGTESSVAYNTTGGGAGLVANFKNAFGDSFDPAICEVDHVLEEGEIELAGIRFVVKPNAEAFDLEIPEINCVYTHMMGHDCHSIVAGCPHADGIISQLNYYIRKGFDLVLTAHYTPEDLKDAQTKVDYLTNLKEIALESESADEMKAKVQEQYPDYSGMNYLDMTVGFFFPNKQNALRKEQNMTQAERRLYLIRSLLNEKTKYQSLNVPRDAGEQRKLLRSLMNVRMPKVADEAFLRVQDEYLQQELADEGITDLDDLRPVSGDLYLWQGDITCLKCGAIVNAANSGMTGCYIPCHACIDNCIHTFAGVQLRQDCAALMAEQGHEEPTGQAKITKAYNLPCDYVLHTVGPIVSGRVTREDERLLASCYRSCLELAEKNSVRSIAFCCISTGVFHFPNERAAEIAVETVRRYKVETGSKIKVVFNVFKDLDKTIYERLLGANCAPAARA